MSKITNKADVHFATFIFCRISQVTNSAGFLLDSMFDFADRMNGLQLTDEEVALFSAIVIIASGKKGIYVFHLFD